MILLFSYNLKIDVSLAPVCFSHFKGLADGLVAKSCLTLVTPWTVARQAPLSKGFPRQDYWSGLPLPSPGIFLTQGPNPRLLHWQVGSLPLSYLKSHLGYTGHRMEQLGMARIYLSSNQATAAQILLACF